jgi:nicotinate phosphoribosyltransferase
MQVERTAMAVDYYALTMVQGYLANNMQDPAVFEFFVREQPPHRNFLVAAGLDQLLEDLEQCRFSAEDLEWLSVGGHVNEDVLEWLRDFRFTGEVHAMPEGTLCFPNEPLVRVTAPLPEAQLVESWVINRLQFQTLIASKAARCVLAAPEKRLVDFGLRRAHGLEAGLLAARASYLAGFNATSNVSAGQRFGIPVSGTMAHAFVQAHDSESASFQRFAHANPDKSVFILDTYDTEAAAHRVVELAPVLKRHGIALKGVRIDSGNLRQHAQAVRNILDSAGLNSVRIVASGNLDEWALKRLTDARAPIDAFGIGTSLSTSADVPALNCAYKLQAYAGKPRRKASEGKATWPGVKQVHRLFGNDGRMARDIVGLESEAPPSEHSLLQHQMAGGKRIGTQCSLDAMQNYVRGQLEKLPEALRSIDEDAAHPVVISEALRGLAGGVDEHQVNWSATTRSGNSIPTSPNQNRMNRVRQAR